MKDIQVTQRSKKRKSITVKLNPEMSNFWIDKRDEKAGSRMIKIFYGDSKTDITVWDTEKRDVKITASKEIKNIEKDIF